MSSEVEPPSMEAPIPRKDSHRILVIVIITVVIVGGIGSYYAYDHFTRGSKYPWLFRAPMPTMRVREPSPYFLLR